MDKQKRKYTKKINKKSISNKKEIVKDKKEVREKYLIVALPRYSRVLKILKKKQFEDGLVKDYGSILLEDGTIIRNNKTYKVRNTDEIKNLIKKGALMAGGSGRRVANG